MDQYEFQRELDEVLPSPDPQLAKRLIDFAEENEIVFYEEYLASLRFIARNFDQDTLASIPKMVDDQNMILPDEMAAAAICVQGGVPVDQVQQMACEGLLMGFFDASARWRSALLWSMAGRRNSAPRTSAPSLRAMLSTARWSMPDSTTPPLPMRCGTLQWICKWMPMRRRQREFWTGAGRVC